MRSTRFMDMTVYGVQWTLCGIINLKESLSVCTAAMFCCSGSGLSDFLEVSFCEYTLYAVVCHSFHIITHQCGAIWLSNIRCTSCIFKKKSASRIVIFATGNHESTTAGHIRAKIVYELTILCHDVSRTSNYHTAVSIHNSSKWSFWCG